MDPIGKLNGLFLYKCPKFKTGLQKVREAKFFDGHWFWVATKIYHIMMIFAGATLQIIIAQRLLGSTAKRSFRDAFSLICNTNHVREGHFSYAPGQYQTIHLVLVNLIIFDHLGHFLVILITLNILANFTVDHLNRFDHFDRFVYFISIFFFCQNGTKQEVWFKHKTHEWENVPMDYANLTQFWHFCNTCNNDW